MYISYDKTNLQVLRASLFNTTITDSTNILQNDIEPSTNPCIFRIYISVGSSGVLKVLRTSGAITIQEDLNEGVALTANSAYIFDIIVDKTESINLMYYIDGTGSTTATLLRLIIVEIGANA